MSKKTQPQKGVAEERLIHIRLTSEVHRRLRVRVAEEDTSIQEWVSAFIERELDRLDTQEAEGDNVQE